MPDVKRQVKLVTRQNILPDRPTVQEGFPMRSWSIEIYLLNENGEEVPATVFDKVTYKLHPSFEKRATQVFRKPPFRCQEEGWGEFDMEIVFSTVNSGGQHSVQHDLHFQSDVYDARHTLTFRNPKADLLAVLRESGPVSDENGARGKKDDPLKKKSRRDKGVDMEKLADGLQSLGEEDLLQVVHMVHENKTSETYTKNDVENGEFHMDLYTLPDALIKQLWDFTAARTDVMS